MPPAFQSATQSRVKALSLEFSVETVRRAGVCGGNGLPLDYSSLKPWVVAGIALFGEGGESLMVVLGQPVGEFTNGVGKTQAALHDKANAKAAKEEVVAV